MNDRRNARADKWHMVFDTAHMQCPEIHVLGPGNKARRILVVTDLIVVPPSFTQPNNTVDNSYSLSLAEYICKLHNGNLSNEPLPNSGTVENDS